MKSGEKIPRWYPTELREDKDKKTHQKIERGARGVDETKGARRRGVVSGEEEETEVEEECRRDSETMEEERKEEKEEEKGAEDG